MLVHIRTTLAADVLARSASSVTVVSSSSNESDRTTSATRRSAGEKVRRWDLISCRISLCDNGADVTALSVMAVNLWARREPECHHR